MGVFITPEGNPLLLSWFCFGGEKSFLELGGSDRSTTAL